MKKEQIKDTVQWPEHWPEISVDIRQLLVANPGWKLVGGYLRDVLADKLFADIDIMISQDQWKHEDTKVYTEFLDTDKIQYIPVENTWNIESLIGAFDYYGNMLAVEYDGITKEWIFTYHPKAMEDIAENSLNYNDDRPWTEKSTTRAMRFKDRGWDVPVLSENRNVDSMEEVFEDRGILCYVAS